MKSDVEIRRSHRRTSSGALLAPPAVGHAAPRAARAGAAAGPVLARVRYRKIAQVSFVGSPKSHSIPMRSGTGNATLHIALHSYQRWYLFPTCLNEWWPAAKTSQIFLLKKREILCHSRRHHTTRVHSRANPCTPIWRRYCAALPCAARPWCWPSICDSGADTEVAQSEVVASGSARRTGPKEAVACVVCVAVVTRTQRSIFMAWVGVAFSSIDINQARR